MTALLCLAAGFVLPGRAQQPLPTPGRLAPSPAPSPSSGRLPDTVRLQFPNTDVADVLDFYAQLTGKRVLLNPNVQGKITILINQPIPRNDAIKLIETQLMLSGFSLVQGDGDVIKVLPATVNARVTGPPIYSDLSQVPDGEQVVSFLFKPRYLTAQKLQQALALYIPIQNQYTSFIALDEANAVLATENSHTIRRLVTLIEALDVPPAVAVDKFIKLNRADATKAVEFVNSVLERDKSGNSTTGGAPGTPAANVLGGTQRRPIRRFNDDGQPTSSDQPAPIPGLPGLNPNTAANILATLSEGAVVQGRVTLTADVRTNRVHVVARPADLVFIEKLINEYDANTPFAEPVRRPLRYLTATDILPILAQSLREPGQTSDQSGQDSGGSTTGGGGASNTSGNRGSSGSSLLGGSSGSGSSLFGDSSSNSLNGSSSTSGGTGGVLGGPSLRTRETSDQPKSALVGTTRIIADPRANVIIVSGGADAREKIFRLLDQLDVPAPQVMIEVLIGELTLNNDHESGIDYLFRSGRRGSDVISTNFSRLPAPGNGTTSTTTTNTDGTTTTSAAATNATLSTLAQLGLSSVSGFGGLAGVITAGNRFAAAIRALESNGRFKTISRPVIFTSNNKEATILSGQEIAIPTQTLQNTTTTTGTAAIASSIQYKEVALQLDVVPLINSDNAVTLDIVQQVKSPVAGSSTNVGGTSVPTIATRVLKSTVTVPDRSTVVLGGLIQQTQEVTRNNIPYLNRIPVIGPLLFSSRVKNNNRSELIIMMKPVVTNTSAQMQRNRTQEENKLYLEPGLSEQLDPIIPKAKPVATKTTTTTVTVKERSTPTDAGK